jgi:phytol kinase
MHTLIERMVAFVADNFPSWRALALGGPPGLVWAFACLYAAGRLKRDRGWKTGYTRKVFHFLIFGTVAACQALWGTPGVCLFGAMCTLAIACAVWRGPGHLLYEALAREKDAPRRTYYVVVPYLATLLGGVASNVLFGPVALVGYLVTGLADAAAEPVGTRFGRHPYRVFAVSAVPATRTLEGSAAVFVMSLAAVALAIALSATLVLTPRALAVMPLLALAATLVEAVSPHGWDNATLQIVPSALAARWLV